MAYHLSNELLNIKNLTKKFGETLILDNISLEIKKGEVCAILGPSGCGKSTFLRCINGLESINGGNIYFRGEDIALAKWRKIREKIGMVFQNYELFPHLNVLENITLAPLKV